MDILDKLDFLFYYQTVGFPKIMRLFWFAFIFEFPRYVVFDFIFLVAYKLRKFVKKDQYRHATEDLFRDFPLTSVIIPGKNEGENIYKLIRSLREQTYKNVQLIVVDDGSDDDTPIICKNLRDKGLIDIFLRNDIRGGKASASNLGLRYAKGDYIILMDADSSLDRNAIENILIPFYMDSAIGGIGGNIKVRNYNENICTSLQAIEYLKTISVGRAVASFLGIYRIIPGALGAFRKDILDKIGGWDVGPGLDGDITVKIRKLGYKIHFEHSSICYTNVPETFARLTKQRLRWYKSFIRFRVRKHRDVYIPDENFRFLNFLSFVENAFFNVILDFKWIIYMVDMAINYPSLLIFIFPINYLLYVVFNILQFIAVIILSERKLKEFRLVIYLPLMPLYIAMYMRAVRTISYFQEFFFRASYKDPWNPWKVSKKALSQNI